MGTSRGSARESVGVRTRRGGGLVIEVDTEHDGVRGKGVRSQQARREGVRRQPGKERVRDCVCVVRGLL
jgi:hypothetical protein